jgi:hypothetical protein
MYKTSKKDKIKIKNKALFINYLRLLIWFFFKKKQKKKIKKNKLFFIKLFTRSKQIN